MGIPPFPTARGYTKLEEYFAEMGNFDLEVLAVKADFGEMPEVKKVSVSTRERRQNRMNTIARSVGNLKDMFISYLTKSVNMFSGCESEEKIR